MKSEFSRPLALDRIGAAARTFDISASPSECVALAARLGVPAVESLTCSFQLTAGVAGIISAVGVLHARVTRTCVISLDDFETPVDEGFALRFVSAGTETDDPDPELPDEIPYESDVLDLGEAAAEQLALALDPYPRAPDAELPESVPGDEEDAAHPFAGLVSLKRQQHT